MIILASTSYADFFGWPVPGFRTISTRYEYPDGTKHSCKYYQSDGKAAGIDISGVGTRTEILAPARGTVLQSRWDDSGFGNLIEIEHDDGKVTLYGHLSERRVTAGQRVARGSVIGLTGSTGKSTGPHLHFEMSRSTNRNDGIDTQAYYDNFGYKDPRQIIYDSYTVVSGYNQHKAAGRGVIETGYLTVTGINEAPNKEGLSVEMEILFTNDTVLSGGKTIIYTKNDTSDGIKWSGIDPDFLDRIENPILLLGEMELTLKKSGELELKLTGKRYQDYYVWGTFDMTFKKSANDIHSVSAKSDVKSLGKTPRHIGLSRITK